MTLSFQASDAHPHLFPAFRCRILADWEAAPSLRSTNQQTRSFFDLSSYRKPFSRNAAVRPENETLKIQNLIFGNLDDEKPEETRQTTTGTLKQNREKKPSKKSPNRQKLCQHAWSLAKSDPSSSSTSGIVDLMRVQGAIQAWSGTEPRHHAHLHRKLAT